MTRKIYLGALALISAAIAFTACNKEDELQNATPQQPSSGMLVDVSENATNPDEAAITATADQTERSFFSGYLYTEGNEAGTNNIHIYRQHANGHLTFESMVASGGAGNAMGLGSQGALALSNNHRWLFAVNAGSNSISAFRVHSDGSLTLTDTKSTDGITPVSVDVFHHVVYVVNSGSADILGYKIDTDGILTPIPGSDLPLSAANATPGQISFSPNGRHLYVTEKMTNKITAFNVDSTGLATFDNSFNSVGTTPFGYSFARDHFMVVSNANNDMPDGGSATSYAGVNSGNLNDVNGAVADNQTASCWVAITAFGRFAFITNTGSDDISSYYVGPGGALHLIHGSAVTTGDAPTDIVIAANNFYVYNINSMSHSIGAYNRTFLGGLIPNSTVSGIPDFAAGLVAW
jgi:6-phosphogluconolactonase